MVKRTFDSMYLIALCLSGALIEGSFDTLNSASYAPLIQEEYEGDRSHFIRLKTIGSFKVLDSHKDLSGYYALRHGLIIGQAVSGDTLSIPGPLDALLDLEKAAQDVDIKGIWRNFIRSKLRDGLDTSKVTLKEMEKLVDHETKKADSPWKDLNILICAPSPDSETAKTVYGKQIENLKMRLEKKDAFTAIILIPLKAELKDDKGKLVEVEGDWATLVIKSGGLEKKGKRLYLVADSGAASPSLQRNLVLIDLLKYFEEPTFEFKKAHSQMVSDKDKEGNALWIQVTNLGKKKSAPISSSETGKFIALREEQLEADKKQISLGRSLVYGIGAGLALLGGYIWMKHRRMNNQSVDPLVNTQI